MKIRVRTKLALLLTMVLAIFVVGLLAMQAYERRRFSRFSAARVEESQKAFEQFLEQWGGPLGVFVQDSSVWDSLVDGLANRPQAWMDEVLTEPVLTRDHVHAVWLYRADGTLAGTRNLFYTTLPPVPMPPEVMQKMRTTEACRHFYAWMPEGLMEFRGATVHPSEDGAREKPERGYFLAGRLWSNAELREMSQLTGQTLSVEKPEETQARPAKAAQALGISFTRALPGWNGQPVATLVVRNESAVVQVLNRSSERLLLGTIGFAALLFGVLLYSLLRWLSRPLKILSKALRTQDPARLERLHSAGDEFGELARLMQDFFAQRESLLREMADRRHAQQALEESEDRLRHSQKMEAVGRLAGGVAHDFNNLLTAIIGYAELIGQQSTQANVRNEAGLISKVGKRAADLTKQLLAFSRKQILQPRVLEMSALVRDIQNLLGRIIGEKISLRFEAAAGDARVRVDPTQLEQVVLNLGVNARDAMPRGGVLSMRTERRPVQEDLTHATGTLPAGLYVALVVQDTGCGMSPETQARIFEPFFTTKQPGQGTGLGLATVYGIVHQSGGAITVESELGVGTTFTVLLPHEDAPVDEPEATLAPLDSPAPQSTTVLVVEDEEIVNELICSVLTAQGYDVICAGSGPEALAIVARHEGTIQLLVTDVIMPEMAGPEIARELQQRDPHLKVLYISGYSEVDISEDGVLSPGVNLLPKPFTPDALNRRVKEVLEQSEA